MKTVMSKPIHRQIVPFTAACRHRSGAVASGRSRTVLDDSGSLAITAWTCTDCGELIEEIRILSPEGRSEARPVRYTVSARMRSQPSVVGH
jgi:hypothetical protein